MKYLWLVLLCAAACTKKGVQPPRAAAGDSADQVYDTMTTYVARNGVRVSRVQAESAWVYTARQVADLKNLTVTMYDSGGAVISTITARRGSYSIRDQNLDARGSVVATSSGGRTLKTEHLNDFNIVE